MGGFCIKCGLSDSVEKKDDFTELVIDVLDEHSSYEYEPARPPRFVMTPDGLMCSHHAVEFYPKSLP